MNNKNLNINSSENLGNKIEWKIIQTEMKKKLGSDIYDSWLKKISFEEVGKNLFAFTAEGDPNSGVIIGDESVLVIDAQATPKLARQVIEKIRTVTDKPISHVVLSHYQLSCCSLHCIQLMYPVEI